MERIGGHVGAAEGLGMAEHYRRVMSCRFHATLVRVAVQDVQVGR